MQDKVIREIKLSSEQFLFQTKLMAIRSFELRISYFYKRRKIINYNGGVWLRLKINYENLYIYFVQFFHVTPDDGLISRNIYIEFFYYFNFVILTYLFP